MASSAGADVSITREQLTKYFHLPITDVAKELGICATMLKKICRKNGIPRWPHRKIKSLNKMIESLQASLPNDGSEAGECIRQEIMILTNKKNLIMRNPGILVQGSKRSADNDDTPSKKSRTDQIEGPAPITTLTAPTSYKPFSPSASFSINQLLTGPTSFTTPLTSMVGDEKDYRSFYSSPPPPPPPASSSSSHGPAGAGGPSRAPFASEYKDPRTAFSPLPSYTNIHGEEDNRHMLEGAHLPSPQSFAAGHPGADPYYYHKALTQYQYQYPPRQYAMQPYPVYAVPGGSPRGYISYHPSHVQPQPYPPAGPQQPPSSSSSSSQQEQSPSSQGQQQQQAQQRASPAVSSSAQQQQQQQRSSTPQQKQQLDFLLPKINVSESAPPSASSSSSYSTLKFRPSSPSQDAYNYYTSGGHFPQYSPPSSLRAPPPPQQQQPPPHQQQPPPSS